ncbi:MAG: hypothetical protein DRH26_01375 [Deltaproteobacteria bacterium]|nr:MAG: hypothetical protein DRH26_01375 [Deltaproteobacteria bacterium]
MKTKSVSEILHDYMEENNFTGLCAEDGECGCCVDDLIPCESDYVGDCMVGYKIELEDDPEGFDFRIKPHDFEGGEDAS